MAPGAASRSVDSLRLVAHLQTSSMFIPIVKIRKLFYLPRGSLVLITWKLRLIGSVLLFQYPTPGQNILDVTTPGELPKKGDKGRLRSVATGSGLIEQSHGTGAAAYQAAR